MSDIKKLKPCPLCQSIHVCIMQSPEQDVDSQKYYGFCYNCCAEAGLGDTEEQAAEAWNALPRRLHWTTEPPTEPDFYWHRDDGVLGIAYIYESAGTLFCHFAGEEDSTLLDLVTGEWAGPIPEPQEPK